MMLTGQCPVLDALKSLIPEYEKRNGLQCSVILTVGPLESDWSVSCLGRTEVLCKKLAYCNNIWISTLTVGPPEVQRVDHEVPCSRVRKTNLQCIHIIGPLEVRGFDSSVLDALQVPGLRV